MERYSQLVAEKSVREHFHQLIIDEHSLTQGYLADLLNGRLRERRPRFYKTLHARDKWLDLLHAQQIELLKTWRQSGAENDLRRVLQSINAVAAGLRTTG